MQELKCNSNFDLTYRKFELIFLYIYLIPVILIFIKAPLDILFPLLFGSYSYMCFICEHKRQFLLNKETNKLLIIEKALFQNLHRVVFQLPLDKLKRVHLVDGRRNYMMLVTEEGILRLLYANNLPLSYMYLVNKVNNINEFLSNTEKSLIFEHTPFTYRVVGILLSAAYFAVCIMAIFQTYVK